MTDDGPYRILPAREEDVRWAAALGARVYGGVDVIPEETMVGWFQVNAHGFSTFWCGSERVGNFDVLPLTAAAADGFARGVLLEREFGPESLIPAERADEIRDLHFESIVIDPDFKGGRSRMLSLFLTTYLEVLGRLCPVGQIGSVSAIAASTAGAGVLRRLGFQAVAEGSARADGHPLYRGTVADYHRAMGRALQRRLAGEGYATAVLPWDSACRP